MADPSIDERERARPGLAKKLGASLAVLALGVVVVECTHRWRRYGAAGFVPAELASIRPLGDSGLVRAAASPNLRFELRPNASVLFKLERIETNAAGMRDEEHPLPKPAGTFRIAVLGDSFTMGSGVAVDAIYPNVLERLLDEDAPAGVRYECLNFGVGGYGLVDYVAALREKVLAYDPDLVLVGLVVNDQRLPPDEWLTKPFVEAVVDRAFLRLTFVEDLFFPPSDPVLDATFKERRQYQKEKVYELVGTLAPVGVRAFFVYLTTTNDEREGEIAARFAKFAEQTGSGFLDTGPLFEGCVREEFEILPGDRHPNARAHAVYARALADALRAGGWLTR